MMPVAIGRECDFGKIKWQTRVISQSSEKMIRRTIFFSDGEARGGARPFRSIQEAEEPERDLVADADFDRVVHDVTVWNVLDLLEGLAFAADFEKVLAIHQAVSEG